MRHRWPPLAGLLIGSLSLLALARPTPAPSVVLISVDALSPRYVLEADRYGLRVPELRRLLAEGSHARAVAGVLPTVTYPSHTTIVTGVSPARHGILYNRPFDPLGRNDAGWYWYAEDIRVPTLWDAADHAGLVTSNVDWPVTVGAHIRYNIVQYWRTQTPDAPDDAKLSRVLSTPGLLAEAEQALGPYPAGYFYTVDADRRRAAFSRWILETKHPRLHLAYFSGLDEEQHASGPGSPRALAALEQIDALIGELRAAAYKASAGKAVIVLVSDHGHSRTTRELRLNEALREAGLIGLDDRGQPASWRAAAWGTGGCAGIMLKDPQDADARRRVAAILERLAATPDSLVQEVLDADQTRAAGGFSGAAFVVCAKPDARIGGGLERPVAGPGAPEGDHGHLAANAEMESSFFLAGPGVPAGRDLGRIDMRDIAPTLAALLRVPLPSAEGHDVLRPPRS